MNTQARSAILDRKPFAEGDVIFKEGDEGRCAYLVQSGSIEIVKEGYGGETRLGVIGAGGIFGEMALIDNKPRMATARALEVSVLVVVGRSAFEEKLRKTDSFVRALLNILVRNVRDISERL